jgi:hypothetical protein
MKYLKTYENWFTNLFKNDGINQITRDFLADMIGDGYNPLMDAAYDGNWNRFKELLPKFIKQINDIHTIYLDSGVEEYMNVLLYVVCGKGDNWEKKKMISALIENNVDVHFESNEKNFYEMIKSPKLKKWIEETYPQIISDLLLQKSIKKYNL